MPPSDLTPAATDAQLLAGWAFVVGLGMLLAVAVVAMAGELITHMANRSKPPATVDRSGYLANLIYKIVEGVATPGHMHTDAAGTVWDVHTLSGGASLWWDLTTRRLMAMRPNNKMEANEVATFLANIKKAGYVPGPAAPVFVDTGLNAYRGVCWTVGRPHVEPLEDFEDPAEPVQGVLF